MIDRVLASTDVLTTVFTVVSLAPVPATAQALPDLPGSTQPVRLTRTTDPAATGGTVDRRAPRARGEIRARGPHRQRLQDAAQRACAGGGSDAFHDLHHERLDAVGEAPRAADPAHGLAVPERLRVGGPRAGRQDRRRDDRGHASESAEGPDAAGWDPFEATLLRLADELFRNSSVSDMTWSVLEARYDLYHLVDAIMTVNEFTLLSMLFNSMGVQPDDGATARFPADVPYRISVPAREQPLGEPRVDPIEGQGLRVGRTFARHPRVAETRPGNSNYVNRVSPLTPHYRELLILRIGWNCQAVYEWAKHVGSVGRARDHGLEPVLIAAGPDAPGWDAFEIAHLHAADEIYRDGDRVRRDVERAGPAL